MENPSQPAGAPFNQGLAATDVDRPRLVAAHQEALSYFAHQLTSSAGASPREYLARRGLAPLLTSTRWTLGYAPRSWTGLTEHLRERGFEPAELILAGLAARTRTGGVVDRFRDRLMLPVQDLAGDPVGFVGRAAPKTGSDIPKYLNSSRSPLYDKSVLLFGLHEQHDLLSAGATPVVVEGPLDALAVSLAFQGQSPTLAAVAPCGTALTARQAATLARFGGERVLAAFDADAAGQRACTASYQVLADHFTDLRTAQLPEGRDPAAILQVLGQTALQEALQRNRPLADVVLDDGLRYWLPKRDNAEARAAAVHELAPTLAQLRPVDATREAGRLAQALGIEHPAITEALTDAVTSDPGQGSTGRNGPGFSTVPVPRQRAGPSLGLL